MGKDVVSFLTWAAEPEMEERKLVCFFCCYHVSNRSIKTRISCFLTTLVMHMQMGFKWIFVLSLALLQAAYYRRLRWSVLKSRKLVLDVVN